MAENFFRPWTIESTSKNVAENDNAEEGDDSDSIISLPTEDDNNIRSPYEGSDERKSNESSSPIDVGNVADDEPSLDSAPSNSNKSSNKSSPRDNNAIHPPPIVDRLSNVHSNAIINLPSSTNTTANLFSYCQLDYLRNMNKLHQPSEMFMNINNGTFWPPSSSSSSLSSSSSSPSSNFLDINAFTDACRRSTTAIIPQHGMIHHYGTPTCYTASVEKAAELVNLQDVAAKQMKKLRPKKFRCEYCDVAFSNNGQLKGHIRIHTGERPYKCDSEGCGKSFTRNEELTRHKRIHTGLRPHICMLCAKRFGRKDHLKKHTRTHENRDPYHVSGTSFDIFSAGIAFPSYLYPK